MTWRSEKLLIAVRQLPCQWCGAEDGTVCAAHSNQLRDGKGRSLKAADYRIAALCHTCHAEIDQGKTMNKEERQTRWELAHRATIAALFENGIVRVK
jgi:hypothetical protein